MKLGTPSHQEACSRKMLRWELEPRELPLLTRVTFPWKQCEHTGEYLVHVSSAFFIVASKHFKGFASQIAHDLVRRYIREARRTFSDEKLTQQDKYDWSKHFTKAWNYRDYQCAGMERVYKRVTRLTTGCLLGDDVGLGKTPQFIGVMVRMRLEGYFGKPIGMVGEYERQQCAVVVTTTSCRSQWGDEIERFSAVKLNVSVVHGSGELRRERLSQLADVYVLNYEMFRLPQYRELVEALMARCRLIGLDETYKIKNPDSLTTKWVRKLTRCVTHRVGFNATPIENGLDDLYAMFDVLDQYVIGAREGFESRYVERDFFGKAISFNHVREFKKRAAVLYLRRTAEDCGLELPEVRSSLRYVTMSAKQERAYRDAAGEYLRDNSRGGVGLAKLAKLQYAALAADMSDIKSDSAKLDDLEALLDGELSGERVVVFTKYRTVAVFAARRLERFKPLLIHGKTSHRDRDTARRRFESVHGVGRLLFCTEAGDRGLNLQAAGVVCNLDLPWNPAKLRQRVGRVRRIGQTRKSVLVLNPCVRFDGNERLRTIDDYFADTILSKRDIVERMFGAETIDDLGKDTLDADAVRDYVRNGLIGASHGAKRRR